ncbi:MAG: hypothetical protein PHE36_00845 [Novosphingobium sp.]|nr:hypothetical protein [Novosphingobium sp.]
MSTGNWLSILFVGLALVLPVTALLGRRVSLAKMASMALMWCAIFVAVALIVGLMIR